MAHRTYEVKGRRLNVEFIQDVILKTLIYYGPLDLPTFAERSGYSRDDIRRTLAALEKAHDGAFVGLVHRPGRRGHGGYSCSIRDETATPPG